MPCGLETLLGFLYVFVLILFGFHCGLWMSPSVAFIRFQKFSAIISLNFFNEKMFYSSRVVSMWVLVCLMVAHVSVHFSHLLFSVIFSYMIFTDISSNSQVHSSVSSDCCKAPVVNFCMLVISLLKSRISI